MTREESSAERVTVLYDRIKFSRTYKLKVEMMYVLANGTATGEVHWPKDATRRMIEVSAGKEADIRAHRSPATSSR